MTGMHKDCLTGGAVALLGLLTLGISFTIGDVTWGGESGRLFPLIVSVLLICLGGGLFAAGLRHGSVRIAFDRDVGRVAGLVLVGAIYTAAISKLGYILPTAVAMPVVFYLFGVRSRLGLLLVATIGPLVYYLIFFKALKVFPPYAPWLDFTFLPWNS